MGIFMDLQSRGDLGYWFIFTGQHTRTAWVQASIIYSKQCNGGGVIAHHCPPS